MYRGGNRGRASPPSRAGGNVPEDGTGISCVAVRCSLLHRLGFY